MLFGAREGDVRVFEAPDLQSLCSPGSTPPPRPSCSMAETGREVAPAVRQSLIERTGGSALALLEVPTALSAEQLAGTERLPEALPLSRAVEEIFLARVQGCPTTPAGCCWSRPPTTRRTRAWWRARARRSVSAWTRSTRSSGPRWCGSRQPRRLPPPAGPVGGLRVRYLQRAARGAPRARRRTRGCRGARRPARLAPGGVVARARRGDRAGAGRRGRATPARGAQGAASRIERAADLTNGPRRASGSSVRRCARPAPGWTRGRWRWRSGPPVRRRPPAPSGHRVCAWRCRQPLRPPCRLPGAGRGCRGNRLGGAAPGARAAHVEPGRRRRRRRPRLFQANTARAGAIDPGDDGAARFLVELLTGIGRDVEGRPGPARRC